MAKRVRTKKKEITLMTLLANEATKESRNILKKYNKPDAKNYDDLEIKLAQLYFETPDKIQLEKELADIHPHKNWILKHVELPKISQTEIEKKDASNIDKLPINFEGHHYACGCSSFDNTNNVQQPQNTDSKKDFMPYIAVLGVMSIVGLTFYMISKK